MGWGLGELCHKESGLHHQLFASWSVMAGYIFNVALQERSHDECITEISLNLKSHYIPEKAEIPPG